MNKSNNNIPDDIVYSARMTDLYSFLSISGIKTTKAGVGRYNISNIPGLVIYNNLYFYFYDDSWGNAVDFLINFLNYDFKSAIEVLTGYSKPSHNLIKINYKKTTTIQFKTPKLSSSQPRVMAYLNKSRHIDIGLIKSFLKHNLLFQTDAYGNCFFPWYYKGEIVGAEIIGTLDRKRFKKIQPGSKGGYGFNFSHPKSISIKSIYFYESAIDLMSYITLYKIELNVLYVSLAGLKPSKIEYFTTLYPNAVIKLCLDNDQGAKDFIKGLGDLYIYDVSLPPEPFKDFNDMLK